MSCPDAGTLRALLDGELADALARPTREHLAHCARCQAEAAALAEIGRQAEARLAVLEGARPDVAEAAARLRARIVTEQTNAPNRRSTMAQRNRWRWRPAFTGVAIVALLAVALSTNPGRVLARQFLSLMRVERVVGVPFDPEAMNPEDVARLEELSDAIQPELVTNARLGEVATVEEASALAGMTVRLPTAVPQSGAQAFEVEGRTEYRATLPREVLAFLLQAAGMDASLLDGYEPGEIRGGYDSAVYWEQDGLEIIQILNPAAEYPEGLDPTVYGEAGLRVLGLPAEDAHRIATSIDWATTLLLPLPTRQAEYRDVSVAGSGGILAVPTDPAEQDAPAAALVWQRDGVLYFVASDGDPGALVAVAESMF